MGAQKKPQAWQNNPKSNPQSQAKQQGGLKEDKKDSTAPSDKSITHGQYGQSDTVRTGGMKGEE